MQEKIIQQLRQAEGYLSGEEISRSLSISRAGIWKHMQEMRKCGYDIVAVPHLGYKLISAPDRLFPAEIKNNLRTKAFGRKIYYSETLSSTMDEAFKLGVEGAPEGTVVCAESQTKGRGRFGRSWTSPKGKGVYFSIILRPNLSPTEISKLTLLAAVAIAEAVHSAAGLPARIKWPNDILVNNKKLVGVLTELSADMDRVKFVAIGVGINVNASASQLPPEATSIKIETGQNCSRIRIIQETLYKLEQWYKKFEDEGFQPVIQKWKDLSVTLGKQVRISDPGQIVEGVAVNVDEDGGLLIRNGSGVVIKKMSGDVVEVS